MQYNTHHIYLVLRNKNGIPTIFGSRLTPLQLEAFFFTNLLEVSMGSDFGVLKGLTPLQLETLFGDRFT